MSSMSFTNLNPTLLHASYKENRGRSEPAPGTAYSKVMFPVGKILFLCKEIYPFPKKTCPVMVANDSVSGIIPSVEHSTL